MVTTVVGESDTVFFTLKTMNAITANGTIQLTFPYLFNVTKDNVFVSMINTTLLSCMDSANVSTSCTFQSKNQTLILD